MQPQRASSGYPLRVSGSGEIYTCSLHTSITDTCPLQWLFSWVGRESEEGITEAQTRNIADIMTAFKFIVNVYCYVHVHAISPASSAISCARNIPTYAVHSGV